MLPVVNYTLNELKTLFQKSWEWRIGYVLIGVFIAARWLGVFSSIELNTLDFFLRHRPAEKEDEHVVIVLIDRSSFQDNGTMDGAMTDRYITRLLETILAADPAVVGLNIFREKSANKESREKLANLFETNRNLIGVQKVLPPNEIPPLIEVSSQVSEQQFGFNDVPIDSDGKIRRVFISTYLPDSTPDDLEDNPFQFSFSFKIATKYLESKGHSLQNFPADPATPSFQDLTTKAYVGLSRLQPTFGGYVRENNIADVQTLLNFRSGTKTFDVFYSENILAESFNLKRLEGKVVIVGSTDSTFPRFLPISASSNLGNKDTEYRQILPRLGITGAELEAHSTSQIINKVLHNRPLIETIPPFLEDAFILLAGIVGILIGNAFKSSQATFQNTSLLVFVVGSLVASGYLLLYWLGIWFPIFPASSILAITGVTYIAFYQSERFSLIESKKLEEEALRLEEETLRLEEERRKTIDKIFNSIHAGPLQTLASLLRDVRDGKLNQEHLTRDLEFLNKEIRGIGERLRQEAIEDVYFVDTRRGTKLDLTHPMHEVFYEVYSLCLQEDLPGFQSIKVRSVVFEPFDCQLLDLGTRQELCWFIQESLENVGKHAIGTSRLFVTGKKTEDLYAICVDDNGPGVESSHCGEGTQFFQRLEKKLGGEFSRFSKPSGGTVCKLAWPLPNRKGTSLQLQPRNHQNLPFKNFQRKTKLDLSRPLHTLFYEICHSYLQADLPGFQSIETCSFAFEPCHSDHLTIDIRRKLCCCLQASLDNVGRHAPGTTRLLVTGTILNGFYTLSVEDNGPGVASSYTGEGTKLFCQLEVLLSGKFSRVISPVGGTICKLTWPLQSLNGEFTSMGS